MDLAGNLALFMKDCSGVIGYDPEPAGVTVVTE